MTSQYETNDESNFILPFQILTNGSNKINGNQVIDHPQRHSNHFKNHNAKYYNL